MTFSEIRLEMKQINDFWDSLSNDEKSDFILKSRPEKKNILVVKSIANLSSLAGAIGIFAVAYAVCEVIK